MTIAPTRNRGGRGIDAELVAHHCVEAVPHMDGHFVDVLGVDRIDDGRSRDVAEEADLPADRVVDRAIGSDDDDVGVNAAAPQLSDGVLGWFGFEFLCRGDVGHQRHMDVAHVLASDIVAELTNGFQEREALDVPHRAPEFADHDVDIVALPHPSDPRLDLVGHMRDDLHGGAEVVTASFLRDHRLVDRPGGD